MKNIAHRGFSGKYPENTLLAFRKAIEINADMIELDITLSKDKIPVVIHDDSLDRTTNAKGLVRSKTLNQIKLLDAGSWKQKQFFEEKIPTLDEVLQIIKKSKIELNIEIKSTAYEKKFSNSNIESQTLSLITNYKLLNRVVISSFEAKILERLRALSSKVKLAYLIDEDFEKNKINPIQFTKEINGVSLNMHKSQINQSIFKEAKSLNIPIFIYTVNTTKEINLMRKNQVDGIFTNYPNRVLESQK